MANEDCALVARFVKVHLELHELGYKVSAAARAFFIHNSKGTIVGDCQSVDGLRAFAQAIEYSKNVSLCD